MISGCRREKQADGRTTLDVMTDVNLTTKAIDRHDADALVLPVVATDDGASLLGPDLPASTRSALQTALTALNVRGEADEVVRIPSTEGIAARTVVFTGLGTVEDTPSAESIRRAAGAALRALSSAGDVALALPTDNAQQIEAVVEGALLGSYRFDRYRKPEPSPVTRLWVHAQSARSKTAKSAVARGVVVAEAVNAARDLVNTSPLQLYPQSFAEEAVAAAKGTKVKVQVLDERKLADGGYGGLIGVGQGSSRPPRLVQLSYRPARARGHVALVGKGITFDSGGLSLKPAKGMEAMKSDMAGAAAVLQTVLAAAALDLPVRVTGWLALAENLPSGTAQRPSDVITIRGGKTVEVLNTDAEGRLVLADALVAAGEENPDLVVDIATLTGAQVVALGTRVSAVMGTGEGPDQVVAAAERAGEDFWPMPLPAELAEGLRSDIADLKNIGSRWGGMLSAGLFLKEFIEDRPWAHLDIAGPAFNEEKPHGYTPVGGTGVAVRTLLTLLEETTGR